MGHLVGKARGQIAFVSLEDLVETDSPARQIDEAVEAADTSYFVKAATKETGRPPYNPKDLLKLFVYGFENGVYSSRKLERETRRNVEVMWLLKGLTPDDKTICNFRRDNAENLVRFFNEFAKKLCREGYIDGKILSIDGTKIRANNGKRNNFSTKKLDRHIAYIDQKLAEYMDELDKNDRIDELTARKAKYESYKTRIESGEVTEVSITDPDSRLMKQGNNGVDVSYNVQTAVDGKNKLIAGIAVTNTPHDQGQLYPVAKSVKDNLALDETTVVADKGYYVTEDFKACHENQITTIVAKPEERTADDGVFGKADFVYDEETDSYTCPAGNILRFAYLDKNNYYRYKNSAACASCALKDRCTKSNRREICRHKDAKHAEQNDKAFKENAELYSLRQQLSEHPFGTVKRTMCIRQFLTRGLPNVTAEAALIFLCYNLKRLRTIQEEKPYNTKDNPLCCTVALLIALYDICFLAGIAKITEYLLFF